jgi:hypothetical protein
MRSSGSGRPGLRLTFPRGVAWAILLGALAGAAVLVAAEFSTLYTVHAAGSSTALRTVRAGSNNSYAMIPIAAVGLALGLASLGGGGRYALIGLALLGIAALLLGLLHDLPDAQRSGLIPTSRHHYVAGAGSPSTGMYLETLGAVILLVTAGFGLLLGQRPTPEPVSEPQDAAG